MKDRIIIGTRRSRLALIQTELVAKALAEAWPGLVIERKEIVTEGDRDRKTSLAEGASVGIFTRAIEEKLLSGEIDLAVHSLKDLPTELPDGLMIAATPMRADPRDVLICGTGILACHLEDRQECLSHLPAGAVIGTSSPRRSAQLLAIRPDLVMKELRGNVDTRLAKLDRGEYDVIVGAQAAMDRLAGPCGGCGQGTEAAPHAGCRRGCGPQRELMPLDPDVMLPAPGQGALAVECREGDVDIERLASGISDSATYLAVSAERLLLERMGGGCRLALGALAEVDAAGTMRLRAAAFSPDGRRAARADASGRAEDFASIVEACRLQLVAAGAMEILSL